MSRLPCRCSRIPRPVAHHRGRVTASPGPIPVRRPRYSSGITVSASSLASAETRPCSVLGVQHAHGRVRSPQAAVDPARCQRGRDPHLALRSAGDERSRRGAARAEGPSAAGDRASRAPAAASMLSCSKPSMEGRDDKRTGAPSKRRLDGAAQRGAARRIVEQPPICGGAMITSLSTAGHRDDRADSRPDSPEIHLPRAERRSSACLMFDARWLCRGRLRRSGAIARQFTFRNASSLAASMNSRKGAER